MSRFESHGVTPKQFNAGIKPSPESDLDTAPAERLPEPFKTGARVDERRGRIGGWFLAAMAYALFCSLLALRQSFATPFVVQDDARQHVTWLLRFVDPGLFPNDLLADYFQSLAPAGYSALYRVFAWLHVDAITCSKLLPGILALVSGAYCFGVCRRMIRAPSAAFFATVILMQSLWMNKDLSSATPRAFFYPLFLAFLYYAARRSRLGVAVTVFLQGVFYPPIVLISLGVLVLSFLKIEARRVRLAIERRELVTLALVLAVARLHPGFLQLHVVALRPARLSRARAGHARLPPWRPHPDLRARRLVQLDERHRRSALPDPALPAFVGPAGPFHLLAAIVLLRGPSHPARGQPVAEGRPGLPRALCGRAHVWLFHLYLPSRYTQHTARMVLSLAAGLALSVILESIREWSRKSPVGSPALGRFARRHCAPRVRHRLSRVSARVSRAGLRRRRKRAALRLPAAATRRTP